MQLNLKRIWSVGKFRFVGIDKLELVRENNMDEKDKKIEELEKRIKKAIVFIENFSLKKSDNEYMTAKQWREKLIQILKEE